MRRKDLKRVTLLVICFMLLSAASYSAVIHVKTDGIDTNDGSSWELAKKTVTAALAASVAGDEIWVASGTYVERITLKDGVKLYGGFAGTETALEQRNWKNNITVLDGSAGGSVVNSPYGITNSTRIDGFTIRNGKATDGGGIYCNGSSPVLSNNTITANIASRGAGIYCFGFSNPTISNNIITLNDAEYDGGGIHCNVSSPVISNNTIALNHGSSSGGIYCKDSSPYIHNNIITGNSFSGIYCRHSSPAITNNTIANNSDSGIDCSYSSSPTISNNIITFNSSGISNVSGNPVVRNNCVYNPGGVNYTNILAGIGDISVDPKFASHEYGQIHIQSDSPCKDTGYDAAVISGSLDMDGEDRIQGAHVDIGADESNGTTWTYTPTVIRVSNAGDDVNNGSSWALAKKTVQAAIDAASVNGAEIWVAKGTYLERITLKTYIYFYGGFAGDETQRDQRNWKTNVTILDGNAGGSVVTASYAGGRTGCIDGFTIRNGNGLNGGGIHCGGSSPAISNNTITANSASSSGGGIYCANSSEISNNIITGNSTNGDGGGIYSGSTSSSTISNNDITVNRASDCGGGIYCYNSSSVISNNTITANDAPFGGGINISSNRTCKVYNNIVAFNSSGIYSYNYNSLTLRNNCVYNNTNSDYTGLSAGVGDISVDPLFADAADHLTPDSPCKDAGDDTVVDPAWLDIDGEARIQGSHVDMGADESDPTIIIIRVTPAGNDANDGSSWQLAKRTVQAAINTATTRSSVEIWVAQGLYTEKISLKPYAYLYGGFAGNETQRDQRNWTTNATILDGSGSGNVVTANNNDIKSSIINGFTIRNGNTGIYCYNSSPVISNNIITGNVNVNPSSYGGGICCYSSSPAITNNIIIANSTIIGGGIYFSSSSPTITNNTIISNSASSYGAGIFCAGNAPSISNNIVAYNSSGIKIDSGIPVLRNNCVYNPYGANYTGLSAGTGDISLDPKLVSLEYKQLHIQPDSPCKDAGDDTVVGIGWMDMDGLPRVMGPHVDMGADESDDTPWTYTPRVIRVSTTGNDANDGSSWELAKRTVQAAIDAATLSGSDIWVAKGIYTERITLKPFAYLYGGFTGDETQRDQRNWTTNVTILDGSAGGSVVTADHIGNQPSRIDGFTIRNGAAIKGGGIYCYSSSPTITNNIITCNVAVSTSSYGGGIYCYSSSPAITNNIIIANSATNGGGIYCSSSSPTVTNNTIISNSSSNIGGGILCDSSSPSISNNIVAFNSSGIKNSSGTPVLRSNCVYNPSGANYTGISAGTGDISVDPGLVSLDYGQLHIQPNSACKDTGYDTAIVSGSLDMDGEDRIQGSHVDMGADESNGTTWDITPRVIRVSTIGNDANDGSSWELAKRRVQAAVNTASLSGGADIWVAKGVYTEIIYLKPFAHLYGGFAGNETQRDQRNWTANTTILDGSGNSGSGVVTAFNMSYGIGRIDGFTIRNANSGVYCDNCSFIVCNNTIKDNSGDGIYCRYSSLTISNNIIINNNMDIYCHYSSPTISNNTIASSNNSSIICYYSSPYMFNNIIAFNHSGIYNISGNPVLRNNCVYNPDTYNYYGLSAGIGDISVDPKFVSLENEYFHIQPDSPCIDTGYDDAVMPGSLDMDGEARIQGSHVDMGADEYNGTPWVFIPNIIRVSTTGDDANDGSSWESDKRTLQAALNAAGKYDQVWVAAGTYNELITLKKDVALYGGFPAGGGEWESRAPAIYETIIDATQSGKAVTVPSAATLDTIIDGFTIRNGKAASGGGINCTNSSATITNNKIMLNTATTNGAGVFASNSTIDLRNNIIQSNTAASGGGIFLNYAWGTIANNIVTSNTATGAAGGGIVCGSSSAVIVNNTIAYNQSATRGGGINCVYYYGSLSNNIVAFNSTGIFNQNGAPVLRNNCVYNPSGANYTNLSAGTGDISVDPLFIDGANNNYHLGIGSPCIDAGYDAAVGSGWLDMDGEARIAGFFVDIGADEIMSTIDGIITVSTTGSDTNDGSSWSKAFRSIQAAINAAESGDKVLVAAGTYAERITLKKDVALYGGFPAGGGLWESRAPAIYETIIDPNKTGTAVTVPSAATLNTIIDGFTIKNGNAINGGGISCISSSATITNNKIMMNTATVGAGICCDRSTVDIRNNIVQSNSARSIGGGMYLISSSGTVASNILTNNTATGTYGGGIFCSSSTAIIVNNTIAYNQSSTRGGGISFTSYNASFANNIVAFNSTGIYNQSGTPILHNNCVYNNINPCSGADYTGLSAGIGDISVDPMFADGANGNYHLSVGSPCIDAGYDASVVFGSLDMDGQSRIMGSSVDMGVDETLGYEFAVGTAKKLADGLSVLGYGAIVTAVFDDVFYIESANRTSGIRVEKTGHSLTPSMKICLDGVLATDTRGERYIAANKVMQLGTGIIKPLYITSKNLGGAPSTGQIGVEGGVGLNNIGLLVKLTGRVTYTFSGGFILDDGTYPVFVMYDGLDDDMENKMVSVLGISSITKNIVTSIHYRCLRAVEVTEIDTAQ